MRRHLYRTAKDNLDSKPKGKKRKRTRSTSKDAKYAEPSEKTSCSPLSTLITDDRQRKRKTAAPLGSKYDHEDAQKEKQRKIASFVKTNVTPIGKLSPPVFGGHRVLRAAGLPRPSSPPHLTKDKLKIPTIAEVIDAADDKPVVWAPPPPPDPPNPN